MDNAEKIEKDTRNLGAKSAEADAEPDPETEADWNATPLNTTWVSDGDTVLACEMTCVPESPAFAALKTLKWTELNSEVVASQLPRHRRGT